MTLGIEPFFPFNKADPKPPNTCAWYHLISVRRFDLFWSELAKRLDVAKALTPEFKDLVNRMIEADPTKRITIKDVKEHKWLEMPMANVEEVKTHRDSWIKRKAKDEEMS